MGYIITEELNKEDAKRPLTTGVYNITGPQRETIEGFWDYLKEQGVIEGYEIKG